MTRVLFILALLCTEAMTAPEIPVDCRLLNGDTQRISLTVLGPGADMGEEDGRPYVSLQVAPGKLAGFETSWSQPPALPADHMIQVTARIRRAPGLYITMHQGGHLLLPPIDYLVAPVWEDITAFLIVPPDSEGLALNLHVRNRPGGRAEATVDIQELQLVDLGAVRELPEPRRITAWKRLELPPDAIVSAPYVVHDGGAGIYRFRATLQTDSAVQLLALQAQGEDPVRTWWRSTEYAHTFEVGAGIHRIECLFYVGDRRFVHQWMRFRVTGSKVPAHLTNMTLEQLAEEPAAAANALPQCPARR